VEGSWKLSAGDWVSHICNVERSNLPSIENGLDRTRIEGVGRLLKVDDILPGRG
jgi:hypothetical protein